MLAELIATPRVIPTDLLVLAQLLHTDALKAI